MSLATSYLMGNLCRTCMEVEEFQSFNSPERETIKDLFSIFSEPQQPMACSNMTILELLKQTTPQLTIDINDILPKNVCKNCLDKLVNIHQFQQNCLIVEQRLLEIVKGNDTTPSALEPEDDPLTSNIIHEAIADLCNIVKIEMQEHLIDASTKSYEEVVSHTTDGINNDQTSCVWMKNTGDGGAENENIWNNPQDELTLSKTCTSKRANQMVEDDTNSSRDNEGSSLQGLADPIIKEEIADADVYDSLLKNRKCLRIQKIHLPTQVGTMKARIAKYEDQRDSTDDSGENDYKIDDKEKREQECEAGVRLSPIDIKLEVTDTTTVSPTSNAAQHDITKTNSKQEEDKHFECDECGSRLKTTQSLKRHKLTHLKQSIEKEESKMKHKCEYCEKVYSHSRYLKDHLRSHTGESYICPECGKSFYGLNNLKQHSLRHGTDRPYECPHCPKKFRCNSDLASHRAIHERPKTHVCDICGAAFVLPYMLKKHKLYHTGEKKFKCDYCDMRFVLADSCRRHMRTHTGEKPYKCKYCVRAFAQSNDLMKHLRVHIGDDVYRCELCPQGFRLLCDLRTHFITHKNDDDETRMRNLQALKNEELRIQLKFGLVQAAEEQ